MTNPMRMLRTLAGLALVGALAAALPAALPAPAEDGLVAEDQWVADKDDNICGISDLKKVSNPGVVDYDELWEATPEIKKMKKEGIDPDSPEGKALRNEAKTRITKACQKIRKQDNLCSVWKAIKHTGSKKPTDITDEVKKLF